MAVRNSMHRGQIGFRPTKHGLAIVAILLGTLTLGAGSGRAALLRLRSQCQSQGPVVTLGDVAEILTTDRQQADAMAAIELFPAPLARRQRFVRIREIQDLLLLRGLNLAEHQFSGSSQVAVLGKSEPAESEPEPPLPPSTVRSANLRVSQILVQYLQERVSADPSWSVQAELDPSGARLVAGPGRAISVSGGAPPWTGLQRFEVAVDTPDGPVRFPLDARVAISPAVVVAVRPLPRGALISPADVRLQHKAADRGRSAAFHSVDEVVGKETIRAISNGEVIPRESVRSPLLVRRGEVVTVYARSPGICVRTVGRARDNGSIGELVAIESLLDRRTYFAQVSNVREVEVYARSPKAVRADPGGSLPVVKR